MIFIRISELGPRSIFHDSYLSADVGVSFADLIVVEKSENQLTFFQAYLRENCMTFIRKPLRFSNDQKASFEFIGR